MSDKRAFAVLDVGYFENPKMMDVLDASSIAVSMHIASVLYCSQHLTDGVISTRAICRKIGGTDADVQTLVDAELWHLPGHSCDSCPDVPEGKAYVHDYLEHNRSSEGAKRTSKKAKAAAEARWAKEKAATPTDAISNAESNAPSMPDALPVAVPEPMPDAMHRQTDRQKLKDLSDHSDEFEKWYSGYRRKEAKGKARTAFKAARRKASFQQLCDGRDRYLKANADKSLNFIALPATWLNAERWDDEAPSPSQQDIPREWRGAFND